MATHGIARSLSGNWTGLQLAPLPPFPAVTAAPGVGRPTPPAESWGPRTGLRVSAGNRNALAFRDSSHHPEKGERASNSAAGLRNGARASGESRGRGQPAGVRLLRPQPSPGWSHSGRGEGTCARRDFQAPGTKDGELGGDGGLTCLSGFWVRQSEREDRTFSESSPTTSLQSIS